MQYPLISEYVRAIQDASDNLGVLAHLICDLSRIVIPDNVTSIGDSAFNGCCSLTKNEIPNGVSCIGFGAFAICESLSSITIANNVKHIGEYAFNQGNSLFPSIKKDIISRYGKEVFGL